MTSKKTLTIPTTGKPSAAAAELILNLLMTGLTVDELSEVLGRRPEAIPVRRWADDDHLRPSFLGGSLGREVNHDRE